MQKQNLEHLRSIKTLPSLIKYLRDELGWPVEAEDPEEATFEYTPEELGIDPAKAAKIREIRQLRPLANDQPWGIFWVNFEPRRLPIVVLRCLLSALAIKRRSTIKHLAHRAWCLNDLLFISAYGDEGERAITFAHFSQSPESENIPILRVLGWDDQDTVLHLDYAHQVLVEKLLWKPEYEFDKDMWRQRWAGAFELGHRESVETSKELAIRLADLARRIRIRVNQILGFESENGPLHSLHKGVREALIHDLSEDDFADMYAQTVTYGLLSARIVDPKSKTGSSFTAHMHSSPFLRDLMASFLRVGGKKTGANGASINFDKLGISEITQLLDEANMEAVVRDFGDRNPQEDPVIHFYELFLKEYDAKKRMQRGVFYTPRPVVSYIVRSIDELLRTDFGLADGLADISTWGEVAKRYKDLKIPEGVSRDQVFVQILDPATGTGTFLVEVIDLVHRTLIAKWRLQHLNEKQTEEMWNDYVPKYLLPRLYGYEILMAPYAIAHLKIGLKLYETGYRFGSSERARIYLTNSLEPANYKRDQILTGLIPALAEEAKAVNQIKLGHRFTVILGNPPYSNFSANLTDSAKELVARYKEIDGVAIFERNALQLERNVNDDYVKFFALSEDLISSSHLGLIGLITNNSYLDAQTLRGLRAHLLRANTLIKILDLGGSGDLSGSRSNAKGRDENVFDIQQGVAITLSARIMPEEQNMGKLRYLRLIGSREDKYNKLLSDEYFHSEMSEIVAAAPSFLFVPCPPAEDWDSYLPLEACFLSYAEGLKTGFDEGLVGFSMKEARDKLEILADTRFSSETIRKMYDVEEKGWASNLLANRRRTAEAAKSALNEIVSFLYRPLDFRYAPVTSSLIKAPSRVAGRNMRHPGSLCLIAARQVAGPSDVTHFLVSRTVPESRVFYTRKGTATYFPILSSGLINEASSLLSEMAKRRISTSLGRVWTDAPAEQKSEVSILQFLAYSYSIMHSESYRKRFIDRLKREFPRIPLPKEPTLFDLLCNLGKELITVHLMESKKLSQFITSYMGPRNPEVCQIGWADETIWLDLASREEGERVSSSVGGFHNVPRAIWELEIGGYQVCAKWLKDRKGRRLSADDIAHYQKIVVALAETIRLMEEIDEVIEAHGGWPGAFTSPKKE